jgi:hypothetical protein
MALSSICPYWTAIGPCELADMGLHDKNIGSCYWPVLRTADFGSLTTASSTGTDITLTVTNPSELARVQSAFRLQSNS